MKRAEHQPVGSLVLYAGIFCKTWYVADAGTLLPQHAHDHPHLTMVIKGAVRVWRDEVMQGDWQAPTTLKIPAQTLHSFLTLTDDVVLACIHAVGDTEEPDVFAEHNLELED